MRTSSFSVLTLAFVFFLGGLHSDAAARSVRVRAAAPVLEELMGGCSLRCAFPWRVEVRPAGAGKASAAKALHDEKARAGWVALNGAEVIGTKFHFVFPAKLPAEIEGQTPVYQLDLINGLWRSEEEWEKHARLRKARLFYNDRLLGTLNFPDTRRWIEVEFPDQMVKSGDSMTLEVLEVYPGKDPQAGLAITEFVLQGAH